MADRMLIDIFEYIKRLGQERYRAFIIHTNAMKSPALTVFCQKLCHQCGGKYLDLLEYFIQSPQLSKSIDRFSPEKFRELLIRQSHSHSLLVVDRVDFLIDTWRKTERQNFYRLVQNQWDSYKEGMRATLVLCLQSSQEIETLKIYDSQGNSRILCLTDFKDIA